MGLIVRRVLVAWIATALAAACSKKAEPVAADPTSGASASTKASASAPPSTQKPGIAYAPLGPPGIFCPVGSAGGPLVSSGGDPAFLGGADAGPAPSSSSIGLGLGAVGDLGAVFGPGAGSGIHGGGFGYRARGTSGRVMSAERLDDKKAGAVACTALPLLRACHEAGGKDGAKPQGIVDVVLEIGAKGEVQKTVLSPSSTLTDATVTACVTSAFAGLTFDPPSAAADAGGSPTATLGYRVWLDRPPKPLLVKDGGPTMGKGLPPEVVRRILRSNFGRITKCYDAALDKDPKLGGELVVEFTIDAKGTVAGTKLAKASAVTEPALTKCVLDIVSKVAFPEPEGVPAIPVTYKWTLSPTRETP